ncbi:hypothetical protein C2E23DRAFT_826037 [Lenzites betulinus]|nr:hypothetical protein C2E23DRAFT_826037 [Lenzites betulinus]
MDRPPCTVMHRLLCLLLQSGLRRACAADGWRRVVEKGGRACNRAHRRRPSPVGTTSVCKPCMPHGTAPMYPGWARVWHAQCVLHGTAGMAGRVNRSRGRSVC